MTRDLLYRFLDLRGLTPDFSEWSEAFLAGNPPRLVRLQRLMTLFRAFRIDWDPASFTAGKFIQPESPRYTPLLEWLVAQMPATMAQVDLRLLRYQLPDCFSILFRYREKLEAALNDTSGVFAASELYAYAYGKVEELNRIIREHVAIIDDILVALICPEAKPPVGQQLPHKIQYLEDDDWW